MELSLAENPGCILILKEQYELTNEETKKLLLRPNEENRGIMTNDKIIAELPNLATIQQEFADIETTIKKLQTKKNKLEHILEYLESVNLVYNGIAIVKGIIGNHFYRAEKSEYRGAEYYLNQHDMKTYGVTVKGNGGYTNQLVGFFETEEIAKQMCLDFVAGEMTPAEFKHNIGKSNA